MIKPEEHSLYIFNHPNDIMRTFKSLWDNVEVYEEHVELLRRLLPFIYDNAKYTPEGEYGLWDITKKQDKRLLEHLEKIDKLLLKVHKQSRVGR